MHLLDILWSYFVHTHIYFSSNFLRILFHSRCRIWPLLCLIWLLSAYFPGLLRSLWENRAFWALQHFDLPYSLDYSVIYEAAESVMFLISWVINKPIKWYWPKYQSSDWSLLISWTLFCWMQPFKPCDSESFSLLLSSINPVSISMAGLWEYYRKHCKNIAKGKQ